MPNPAKMKSTTDLITAKVIAPGPDKKGEQPAKIRLYSIASSAVGDDQTSKTVSLCVLALKLGMGRVDPDNPNSFLSRP